MSIPPISKKGLAAIKAANPGVVVEAKVTRDDSQSVFGVFDEDTVQPTADKPGADQPQDGDAATAAHKAELLTVILKNEHYDNIPEDVEEFFDDELKVDCNSHPDFTFVTGTTAQLKKFGIVVTPADLADAAAALANATVSEFEDDEEEIVADPAAQPMPLVKVQPQPLALDRQTPADLTPEQVAELKVLTGEILDLELAIKHHEREATKFKYEQGVRLGKIQRIVGQGRWLRWCDSDGNPTGLAARTISERMRFAEKIDGRNRDSLLILPYTQALETLGIVKPRPQPKPKSLPPPPKPGPTPEEVREDAALAAQLGTVAPNGEIAVQNCYKVIVPFCDGLREQFEQWDDCSDGGEARFLSCIKEWARRHPTGFSVNFQPPRPQWMVYKPSVWEWAWEI